MGDSNRMVTSWNLLILNLAAAPKPEDGNKNEGGIRRSNKVAQAVRPQCYMNEWLTGSNCRAARARPFDQRIDGLHPLTKVRLSNRRIKVLQF